MKPDEIAKLIPDEVVEAVAKVIATTTEPIDKWRYHLPEARAAIAAARPAIRAEALEEAAKAADEATAFDDALQKSAGCWTTGQRIAASIRALKDQP
jgi:hypothetical protein